MDGIINVYKEAGFTSHDVVAKLRGILHQKKSDIQGHWTLWQSECFLSAVEKRRRYASFWRIGTKHIAVCRLGIVTDTQDTTGKILEEVSVKDVTKEQIVDAVESFRGSSMQIPPMYSALKVGGRKLYELAREGVEVERKPREIFISDIKILQMDIEEQIFSMEVTCSKGTYIRTLCHDIGQKLGVGAAMENLVRTRVGNFQIADAMTLDVIEQLSGESEEEFMKKVYTVDSLFSGYPKFQIKQEYAVKLANGNILKESFLVSYGTGETGSRDGQQCLVYDENGSFKAVYKRTGKDFTVIKMF